jgi:hypothetical protein
MFSGMREWLILVAHLIVTMMKVAAPGGVQSVVAESLILKHQLLILNRSRKRAPKLWHSRRTAATQAPRLNAFASSSGSWLARRRPWPKRGAARSKKTISSLHPDEDDGTEEPSER